MGRDTHRRYTSHGICADVRSRVSHDLIQSDAIGSDAVRPWPDFFFLNFFFLSFVLGLAGMRYTV